MKRIVVWILLLLSCFCTFQTVGLAEKRAGLVVTESSLLFDDAEQKGYFSAKVENKGPTDLFCSEGDLIVYDAKGNILFEDHGNCYPHPFNALIESGDFIYVSLEYWNKPGLKAEQIDHFEYKVEPARRGNQYERIPCEAKFAFKNEYGMNMLNLEVTLENNTGKLIQSPQVVYAFYDENHQLVDVGEYKYDNITVFPGSKIVMEPPVLYDFAEYLVKNNKKPKTVETFVYYYR